jgi:hypothetical protein
MVMTESTTNPDAAKRPAARSPTIVCIAAVGHSGSTLLDLILSSHSAVTSVGEAARLRTLLDARCTCLAKSMRVCPFWSRVDRMLHRDHGMGLDDLDLDADDDETLLAHNRIFYHAVSEVSGKPFIVDSSKRRLRVAAMLASGQFDVRPVHLIRHPFGVTFSNMKKGRAWFRHARHYGYDVHDTKRFLRRYDHAVVRYEQLVADPEGVLGPLMRWLGLSFEPAQLAWAQAEHHNIGGNRMRFSTDSAIRLDEKWRRELTPTQKLGIMVMTLPAGFPWWFAPATWIKSIRHSRAPKADGESDDRHDESVDGAR